MTPTEIERNALVAVLGRLEQQYGVVDPVGVNAYLERLPFLAPIVEDAYAAILENFGMVHHVDSDADRRS